MRLNPLTEDHFRNPRNVGHLEHATHRGAATNPVCMDRLAVELRIEDDVVREASFTAEGCPPTIAVGSILTEKLLGLSASEVESLEPAQVIAWLEGVPPGKDHVGQLAVETLRNCLRSAE